MREIEFRFVYQGKYRIHYKWYSLEHLIDRSLSELSDIHHQMKLIAKNQYTGKKDKDEEKIFEGDIYKSLGHYIKSLNNKNDICVIVFENGKFYGKTGKAQDMSLDWISKHCVKIGNKFENPELLKDIK